MSAAPKLVALREEHAWICLAVSTAAYFFLRNVADNDLWMHVMFGRLILSGGAIPNVDTFSYTIPAGREWINHEWLAQAVAAAVWEWLGSPGLLALKASFGFVTAWLIWRRLGTFPIPAASFLTVLSIAVLARGFAIRPQIVTYLFLALTFEAIERERSGQKIALLLWPLLVVVWVNSHAGFLAGVLSMCGYALWSTIVERRGSSAPMVAALLGSLAILFNPYGIDLLYYIVDELGRGHPITEWAPVTFSDPAHVPFFALAAIFLVTTPLSRASFRAHGWKIAIAGASLYLAFRHQRHTPLFAICAAPAIALAGSRIRELSSGVAHLAASPLLATAIGLLATFQVLTAAAKLASDSIRVVYEAADYPFGAVRYLTARSFRGNLAVPLEWGNYVMWHLGPSVKVSLDGRFATIYDSKAVNANFDLYGGSSGDWTRLLRDWPTDAILAPRFDAERFLALEGWKLVYGDPVSVVFVRSELSYEPGRWDRPGLVQWLHFP